MRQGPYRGLAAKAGHRSVPALEPRKSGWPERVQAYFAGRERVPFWKGMGKAFGGLLPITAASCAAFVPMFYELGGGGVSGAVTAALSAPLPVVLGVGMGVFSMFSNIYYACGGRKPKPAPERTHSKPLFCIFAPGAC